MIYDRHAGRMHESDSSNALHFNGTTRHRTSRWLPVVALSEKSRGCGGDGEWWQTLCRGFDGFRVSSVLMFLHYASTLTLMTLINA